MRSIADPMQAKRKAFDFMLGGIEVESGMRVYQKMRRLPAPSHSIYSKKTFCSLPVLERDETAQGISKENCKACSLHIARTAPVIRFPRQA